MRGGWRGLLSVLADVASVAGLALVLVAGRGYAVGRLSRASLVVVLVGVVMVLGLLAYVRRRAWWGVVRPRYVSCVAWLAKPVGEEVRGRLGGGSWVEALGEVAVSVPRLEVRSLRVLQFALAALDSAGGGPCVLDAHQLFPRLGYGAIPEAQASCRGLVEAGMVSRYEVGWGDRKVQVWLRGLVKQADEGGELSRLVREELMRRGP